MHKKKSIEILLHDIRSVHNVGSIFRTADALGVSKIYISGFTPTPLDRFGRMRKDLAKVALGAQNTVSWQAEKSPKELVKKLKKAGYQILVLEQVKNSVDYKKVKAKEKVLFIAGNEVSGVDREILKLCDEVCEIKMMGKKESLNVSVALAVAMFRILNI